MKHFLTFITIGTIIILCSILFLKEKYIVYTTVNFRLFILQKIMIMCCAGAILACLFDCKKFRFNLLDGCISISLLAGIVFGSSSENLWNQKLLLLGILYFLLRYLFYNRTFLTEIFSILFLTTGIIECLIGYGQLYGFIESNNEFFRLTGSFFNPGPFSGFLAMLLPISLYWILKLYPKTHYVNLNEIKKVIKTHQSLNYLLFGISVLCFFCILTLLPAGMSRSSWIAGCVGCSIVLTQHYEIVHRIKYYTRKHCQQFIAYGIIILLLIAGILTGAYLIKKDSADGRMLIWKISTRIIKENPWTGIGAGNFAGAFGQAQADYFASGSGTSEEEWVAGSPEYAFNEYLQITVEYGVIGILLFLAIFSSAFRQISISPTKGSNGIAGALVSMLTFAMFSYPFSLLSFGIVGTILLALAGSSAQQESQKEAAIPWRLFPSIKLSTTLNMLFVFLLTGITLILIRHRETVENAYFEWAKNKSYFTGNMYKGVVRNYRYLYPILKREGVFLYEYGYSLAALRQYEASNRMLYESVQRDGNPMSYNKIGKNYQAMKQYRQAEEAFLRAHFTVPHKLYPLYLLSKMYFESGEINKGINIAQRLLAKEPKIKSTATEDMKAEIKAMMEKYVNLKNK